MMKGFLTSGELMEAVKALDYKARYKVCEAFYKRKPPINDVY